MILKLKKMVVKNKNDHLIPVLITNLIDQFKKCDTRSGEYSALAERLTYTRDYIDEALKDKNFK